MVVGEGRGGNRGRRTDSYISSQPWSSETYAKFHIKIFEKVLIGTIS